MRYGLAALLFAAIGFVSCQGRDPGGGYRPSVIPLGWTVDGSLLFVHQEEEGGYDWRSRSCGGSGLYALAEGSGPKPIFTGARWCDGVPIPGTGGPSLSRDGRTLFSAGDRSSGHCGVVLAIDISRQQPDTVWRDCSAEMDNAAVSSDGRWIVARRVCTLRMGGGEATAILPAGCVDGDGRLRVAPLQGGAARSVGTIGLRSPVWSPDSRSILAAGKDGSIVRLDVTTGEQRVVAQGHHPAWSPDGRWIAFARMEGGDARSVYSLRIVRADGSGELVLFTSRESWFSNMETRVDGSPGSPLWSPDGRRLIFVRAHHRGGTLWSVRSDGTGLRQLTRPIAKHGARSQPGG